MPHAARFWVRIEVASYAAQRNAAMRAFAIVCSRWRLVVVSGASDAPDLALVHLCVLDQRMQNRSRRGGPPRTAFRVAHPHCDIVVDFDWVPVHCVLRGCQLSAPCMRLDTRLEPFKHLWAQPLRPGERERVWCCQEEGAVWIVCERDDAGIRKEDILHDARDYRVSVVLGLVGYRVSAAARLIALSHTFVLGSSFSGPRSSGKHGCIHP